MTKGGAPSGRCALRIVGATVIDGTGGPARRADVAIDGSTIVTVGDVSELRSDETIDGAGKVLAPGFIDVHTHDDLAVFETPEMDFKVSQGVTTVIAGNCGISAAPVVANDRLPDPFPLLGRDEAYRFPDVADYRAALTERPASPNVALLVGHSALRVGAMAGDLNRPADGPAVADMADVLRLALRQGAIGMSSGLAYRPAKAATEAEMVSLVSVLGDFPGRVYTTHMRDESDGVLDSVQETIRTARTCGVPTVISHHKCAGAANHGRSIETLAAIAAACVELPLALDMYPYVAGSTVLALELLRLSRKTLISHSEPYPEMAGRLLADIALEWDCTEEAAAQRLMPAGAIYFQMDEEDVQRIMAFPQAMIGSDGLPGQARPHPRLWGTFPRVLGHYVRDLALFSLEQGIHKMTGLSARTFGLEDRGEIREGRAADLVLFDPAEIADRATFDAPDQPARGIDQVFVNGVRVWSTDGHSHARPGLFLGA